jgi:hypothetical protein
LGMRAFSSNGKELSLAETKAQRPENAGESIYMEAAPKKKSAAKSAPERKGKFRLTPDGGYMSEETLESRRLGGRIYVEGNSSWEQSEATMYGAFIQKLSLKLQDKYSNIMLLQQDVEVFNKEKVPESQDFEMSMDIMYGKLRTDIEALEATLDGVLRVMDSNGITADQLSDYLYAKHAKERNEFIGIKRPELLNGSGMTNEEAEEILNELESPEMMEVANRVYDILKNTRQTMFEGGLETRESIETWEGMYEYYVPLNGLADNEKSDGYNDHPTGGAGMAIYGSSVKAAKGRPSKTGVNLLANIVVQNMATHQRARKDQAMLSLYNLVEKNPNEGVWAVYSGKNPKMTRKEGGEMGRMTVPEMKHDRRMVPIRVNGEQHFIYFENLEYAKALNGMGQDKTLQFTKWMAKPMNLMRNAFTQYNPAFFVTNFGRDIHGAVYNAMAEIENEGGILQGYGINTKEFTTELIKESFNMVGLLGGGAARGKAGETNPNITPEILQHLREWEAAGGRTGFSYSDTISNLERDLKKKASDKSRFGKGAEYVFKHPKDFFNYIGGVNEAFENSIRLAAYIQARKAGLTQNKAAQLSKNITVNFNKSGELGQGLNQMFLFFNAAAQGVSRFTRTFAQNKAALPDEVKKLSAQESSIAEIEAQKEEALEAHIDKFFTEDKETGNRVGPNYETQRELYDQEQKGRAEINKKYDALLTEINKQKPKGGEVEVLVRMGSKSTPLSSARKLAAAQVLVSGMTTLINLSMSDRDDEDGVLWWMKTPDYKKERGFGIMVDGKNSIFIPQGYGYNMFNLVGMLLAEVAAGEREFDDAAMFMGLSTFNAFSPISAGGTEDKLSEAMIKGITPTVFKAPLDAFAWNETYFGGPVTREQLPPFMGAATVPESSLAFRGPDWLRDGFIALNEMTGGTKNQSGTFDINPDPYTYIVKSYVGGAGNFVGDLTSLGINTGAFAIKKSKRLSAAGSAEEFVDILLSSKDEEGIVDFPVMKFSDAPIVGGLYGGPTRYHDIDLYEKNTMDIKIMLKEIDEQKEDPTYRPDIDATGVQALEGILKEHKDKIKIYRDLQKKTKDLPSIQERTQRAYEIQEGIRTEMAQFNKKYEELRGQFIDPKSKGIIPLNTIRQAIGTDE